jgi:anaerobic nitric oxide reductase transcription regulator
VRLATAEWPGNVRELENVISRAVLRASFGRDPGEPIVVGSDHLDLAAAAAPPPREPLAVPAPARRPLRERVRAFEREAVREAVARHSGNWAAAARELGLHRSNLHQLAKRLGLRGAAADESD